MSHRARFYGLPESVVKDSLLLGVHPDCLLSPKDPKTCPECNSLIFAAIDKNYPQATLDARMAAIALDVEKEQRDE